MLRKALLALSFLSREMGMTGLPIFCGLLCRVSGNVCSTVLPIKYKACVKGMTTSLPLHFRSLNPLFNNPANQTGHLHFSEKETEHEQGTDVL